MNDCGQSVASLPRVQRLSAVLWPSYLLAGVATIVFFALIDPIQLLECRAAPPLSRTAAYSVGFFAFWLLAAGSAAACYYLLVVRVPPRAQDALNASRDDTSPPLA